jgi:hypothetical protein
MMGIPVILMIPPIMYIGSSEIHERNQIKLWQSATTGIGKIKIPAGYDSLYMTANDNSILAIK